MKCPECGIEMKRESADKWVCRNPRCRKGKEDHGSD